ncbi:uncharacterized protein L3040_005135 [Drepanopeziza brunnea f. sp. 'multigermtubi']|uniref:uncharacterized protein n=1 Tax=Drepanopeziza brunnea f. sp. 'multigermtubi' TaxID=698441 RepID=UPI00239B330E|nr:hypothetical protein L3040_005135 [Drepanopeziza brunnea f. sp. 'multigermtubi']
MLPPPTLSFTIPSIQEDVALDCRVYHPASLAPTSISHCTAWNKKAAIVAHPYAPLGGSYDDPVVGIIADLLLKQNFVVGTFNFRGAGISQGRTSWQAKAEQKDYISFLAFMVYYCKILSPQRMPFDMPSFTRSDPEVSELSPVLSGSTSAPHSGNSQFSTASLSPGFTLTFGKEGLPAPKTQPRLLLAGYSYGALITSLLPPIISSLISPFQAPDPGSAYAEIRLRAESLAARQNQQINRQAAALLRKYSHRRSRSLQNDDVPDNTTVRKPNGVRIGGGEDLRRASHESSRATRGSFSIEAPELVRKSVDRARLIGKHRRMSPRRHNPRDSISSNSRLASRHSVAASLTDGKEIKEEVTKEEVTALRPIPGIVDDLQIGYLLVSPLQGVINSLATLWTSNPWRERGPLPENEIKFTVDPTLALFGDDDAFVSAKRLRPWAEKLSELSCERGGEARFRYVEVPGAGHFWHDRRAVSVLRDQIRTFVRDL